VLLVAFLTLIPSTFFTLHLGFKPDFAELLPDHKDSVVEMRRVSKRLPGITSLTVTAEIADGKNEAALVKFVDTVVPKLEALGQPWVERVEWGSQETKTFFDKNKLLFAKTEDLQKARDEVVGRYEYEVQKQAGMLLDDSDANTPPPISAASIRDRLTGKTPGKAEPEVAKPDPAKTQHSNGYYMSADGKFAAIVARTSLSSKKDRLEFIKKVRAIIEETQPKTFDSSMEVGFTGDLIISGEEYDAIVSDLNEVGIAGVLGVLIPVLLFFLRIRTVIVMAGSLLVGLLWTFGLTYFTIGYFNTATGFLTTIIAGNSINYGIMYMARYIEARRDEGLDVEASILAAHTTWLATLSSSATAMVAYGALILTDFRGFKHFGIIGGYGMLICWIATYLFLPPMLAATERILPAYYPSKEKSKIRGYYGILFAKLAFGAPRLLGTIGVLTGLVAIGMSYRYLTSDPMEYDMRNVRNDIRNKSAAVALSVRAGSLVGRMSQDGMAIMTDRLDQVPMLETELQKRYDEAPEKLKPFEKIVTIASLIPKDQEAKIPLIEEIRKIVQKAHRRGFIPEKDWGEIAPYLPEGDIKTIGIGDLPEKVARSFTEKDGTRGRIVYIVPKSGESVWDAHYLMRWADGFRKTTLPTGEVIKGSGRAVIYADMIKSIVEDAPKPIFVAVIGVIVIILIAFRGSSRALGVFIPWLFGVSMLVAFLYLKNVKLNFLNFIVLPITFGIGADYSHNLMQRYLAEKGQNLERVFIETGGALVLCSLTTSIGYIALMFSINKGIASFGVAAAVGELTCLLSSVLILPSFLVLLNKRNQAKETPPPQLPADDKPAA
jgi:predicted RND superfamily exporter protein